MQDKMSSLIFTKTVWNSGGIPESIFLKTLILKNISRGQKIIKDFPYAKSYLDVIPYTVIDQGCTLIYRTTKEQVSDQCWTLFTWMTSSRHLYVTCYAVYCWLFDDLSNSFYAWPIFNTTWKLLVLLLFLVSLALDKKANQSGGYKTFFILNSSEHKSSTAHKDKWSSF